MKTVGRLLVADLYHCDLEVLDDKDLLEQDLRKAALAFGATIVGSMFHRYPVQGVSGAILIAESHLSIHTWPEAGYAAVDIYTCGDLDPRAGIDAADLRIMSRSTDLLEFGPREP